MQETYFKKHIYLLKYEGIIRDKILEYKFDRKIIHIQNICKNFIK